MTAYGTGFLKILYFFKGDLIPWTMAQQFQDDNFPQLSGARIVRYYKQGSGSRLDPDPD
jgi:tRNA(Met) C34 N-acetyltransferase TmcA